MKTSQDKKEMSGKDHEHALTKIEERKHKNYMKIEKKKKKKKTDGKN